LVGTYIAKDATFLPVICAIVLIRVIYQVKGLQMPVSRLTQHSKNTFTQHT